MGDNNRGSYSGLVKPVPTITYGEESKINDAYKKLVQQGFKGTYADFRSGFSNKIDDILSGKLKFSTPQSRTQAEIQAAGGYQQYLRQKKQEALEQFERQKAEVQAYNNNPQEYIKTHSGLGVEEFQAPSIEQARLAYNNTMRYLNSLNPDGSVRTSRNTAVNKNVINRNTVNRNTDVNNNFNIKAFQNWVLQRNKFWKSRDYNNNVYSLGKFGADGIMGKYTRNAYNALKNEYNKYLKSGMKTYSNFYNKYIYKDPTDLIERMNDRYEILNANSQVNDILDTTIPKVEFNPIEPYTHDEYVNNKLNIMRQYRTNPTPQENNHNVTENDMIGLKNTTLFKFGGMIPKYQNGSLFEKGMSYVSNKIRQARDSEFIEGADREVGQNITGNNVGRFVLNRIANNLDPNSTLFGWKMPPGIRTILGSPVTLGTIVPTINPASIGFGTLQYISDKTYGKPNENQNKKSTNSQVKKPSKLIQKHKYIAPDFYKNGGIIKAAYGWQVSNGKLQVQTEKDSDWIDTEVIKKSDGLFYYRTKHGYWMPFSKYDKSIWDKTDTLRNSGVYKSLFKSSSTNTGGTKPVTPVDTSKPVQSNTSTSFTPEQFLEALLGNDEYIKRFKQLLGIQENPVKPDETQTGVKPESEVTKTEVTTPTAPTYESLVGVNTASMNGNINSGYFRKQFRKAFNKALLDGTIYGINNPNGTQVFDSNAVIGYNNGNPIYATATNIIQKYGLDGKISRRDMRMLRKDIIGNQNQVRMNNVSNFLGIQSEPAPQIQLNPIDPVQIDNSVSLLGPEKINPGIDFINNLNSSNLTSNTSPRLEGSEDLPEWMQS